MALDESKADRSELGKIDGTLDSKRNLVIDLDETYKPNSDIIIECHYFPLGKETIISSKANTNYTNNYDGISFYSTYFDEMESYTNGLEMLDDVQSMSLQQSQYSKINASVTAIFKATSTQEFTVLMGMGATKIIGVVNDGAGIPAVNIPNFENNADFFNYLKRIDSGEISSFDLSDVSYIDTASTNEFYFIGLVNSKLFRSYMSSQQSTTLNKFDIGVSFGGDRFYALGDGGTPEQYAERIISADYFNSKLVLANVNNAGGSSQLEELSDEIINNNNVNFEVISASLNDLNTRINELNSALGGDDEEDKTSDEEILSFGEFERKSSIDPEITYYVYQDDTEYDPNYTTEVDIDIATFESLPEVDIKKVYYIYDSNE